ncbi:jg3223 [Pararge aegeria aegeria]|uniref:Jg3223 protein n=1 Tax=Pararge aegeria aegeria TaxID=348720 RepID=A0A8S4R1Q6_9NEOP|nr:jg3223 [Pararge aegeria aegeria]
MDSANNITLRRKFISNSLADLSFLSSKDDYSLAEASSIRSLPDTSAGDTSIIADFKIQIEKLNLELQSAHAEIDKLNSENQCLIKNLEKYHKTINILKKIGIPDTAVSNINTPTASKLRKIFYKPEFQRETEKIRDEIESTHNQFITTQNSLKKGELDLNKNEGEGGKNENGHKMKKVNRSSTNMDMLQVKNIELLGGKNDQMRIDTQPRIIILGDQQAMGLSSLLVNKWKGRWNNSYSITGFIKPYAKSKDVLSYCQTLAHSLGQKDRIILNLGANDSNPFEVLKVLLLALDKLKGTKVFVTQVNSNATISENVLNMHISSVLKLSDNCILLKNDRINLPQTKYIDIVSDLIIHEISKIDYEDNYIFSVKKKFNNLNSKKLLPKKGTIPYYFKPMTYKIDKHNVPIKNPTSDVAPKRGTIPFYFKPNNNKAGAIRQKFFRTENKF